MKSGLIGKTKSTIFSWSFKYTQNNLFWEPPPLKNQQKQTNKIQQMNNKNSNNTDHYDGRIAI